MKLTIKYKDNIITYDKESDMFYVNNSQCYTLAYAMEMVDTEMAKVTLKKPIDVFIKNIRSYRKSLQRKNNK